MAIAPTYTEVLTFLGDPKGNRIGKRIAVATDGTWTAGKSNTDISKNTFFSLEERRVSNADEAFAAIRAMANAGKYAFIQGTLTKDGRDLLAKGGEVNRRLSAGPRALTKEEAAAWKANPKGYKLPDGVSKKKPEFGEPASFRDEPHCLHPFDIDKTDLAEMLGAGIDIIADPVRAAEFLRDKALPKWLQGARMLVAFSSKAGSLSGDDPVTPPGRHHVRGHVFVWLDRPITSTAMREVIERHNEDRLAVGNKWVLDAAIHNAVQVLYIAAPSVFDDSRNVVADPLPIRHVVLDGTPCAVFPAGVGLFDVATKTKRNGTKSAAVVGVALPSMPVAVPATGNNDATWTPAFDRALLAIGDGAGKGLHAGLLHAVMIFAKDNMQASGVALSVLRARLLARCSEAHISRDAGYFDKELSAASVAHMYRGAVQRIITGGTQSVPVDAETLAERGVVAPDSKLMPRDDAIKAMRGVLSEHYAVVRKFATEHKRRSYWVPAWNRYAERMDKGWNPVWLHEPRQLERMFRATVGDTELAAAPTSILAAELGLGKTQGTAEELAALCKDGTLASARYLVSVDSHKLADALLAKIVATGGDAHIYRGVDYVSPAGISICDATKSVKEIGEAAEKRGAAWSESACAICEKKSTCGYLAQVEIMASPGVKIVPKAMLANIDKLLGFKGAAGVAAAPWCGHTIDEAYHANLEVEVRALLPLVAGGDATEVERAFRNVAIAESEGLGNLDAIKKLVSLRKDAYSAYRAAQAKATGAISVELEKRNNPLMERGDGPFEAPVRELGDRQYWKAISMAASYFRSQLLIRGDKDPGRITGMSCVLRKDKSGDPLDYIVTLSIAATLPDLGVPLMILDATWKDEATQALTAKPCRKLIEYCDAKTGEWHTYLAPNATMPQAVPPVVTRIRCEMPGAEYVGIARAPVSKSKLGLIGADSVAPKWFEENPKDTKKWPQNGELWQPDPAGGGNVIMRRGQYDSNAEKLMRVVRFALAGHHRAGFISHKALVEHYGARRERTIGRMKRTYTGAMLPLRLGSGPHCQRTETVEAAWHGNVAGLNTMEGVDALVILGVPEPEPVEFESSLHRLYALDPTCRRLPTSQLVEKRIAVAMSSGEFYERDVKVGYDPRCDAYRQLRVDAALAQAEGRARAIWRDPSNPCRIYIFGDTYLDRTYNRLLDWGVNEFGTVAYADIAAAYGCVPTTSRPVEDTSRLYPGLIDDVQVESDRQKHCVENRECPYIGDYYIAPFPVFYAKSYMQPKNAPIWLGHTTIEAFDRRQRRYIQLAAALPWDPVKAESAAKDFCNARGVEFKSLTYNQTVIDNMDDLAKASPTFAAIQQREALAAKMAELIEFNRAQQRIEARRIARAAYVNDWLARNAPDRLIAQSSVATLDETWPDMPPRCGTVARDPSPLLPVPTGSNMPPDVAAEYEAIDATAVFLTNEARRYEPGMRPADHMGALFESVALVPS